MNAALSFQNVDILFAGAAPKAARRLVQACRLLDAGDAYSAIAHDTGVTVGVNGATLDVAHGEISVLMGASGSGKSTLLRAANGLSPVQRGQVLINDDGHAVDVATADAATLRQVRRRRVAMVFQQSALLPWRSVRDNVAFGLELQGISSTRRARLVEEKLALVGLLEWADRDIQELSGGMQQRVGLARAFATDADILLMDEPFSALDPLIREKLQDELLALQARVRKTILFVGHDLSEAIKLGDRISIMEAGRIVQSGTAQDIILRPVDSYVAAFARGVNPLSALTGAMVMRPCTALTRSPAGIALDPDNRYLVQVDDQGLPLAVRIDGLLHALVTVAGHTVPLRCVPTYTVLRDIIRLRQSSGHPVLLLHAERWVGVCSDAEILQALAVSLPDP